MPAQRALRGFTLIELVTVVGIIALLTSITLVALSSAREAGRDGRRMQDLGELRKALELYIQANGNYPASPCGYNCNAYYYSNTPEWQNTLGTQLAPYLSRMPVDPINAGPGGPWNEDTYVYTYGNVFTTPYAPQYDLTAQFENDRHRQRCGLRAYRWWVNGSSAWCGSYSPSIYEASPL